MPTVCRAGLAMPAFPKCQAPHSRPSGPTAAGRSPASWLPAKASQQRGTSLPAALPRAPFPFPWIPVTRDGNLEGGEAALPVCGRSGCKAHLCFSSPAILKGILQVFSPHLHRVRVFPWLTELNFGSKHGIYTARNNVQEGTTDRRLLIDHDVIHWEAHTL